MTISIKCFEEVVDNKKVEAYWLNNGLFWCRILSGETIQIFNHDFDVSLTGVQILPSEMKQILENENFESEFSLRPSLFPIKGRVISHREGEYISIKNDEPDYPFYKEVTLPKTVWKKIYEACIENRDKSVVQMGGRMIEPIVGISKFQEEYNNASQ